MPKSSTRRNSRLTTPVMITFVVVAVVMLALTITSVVKAMTRGDDPVVVNAVLTGQSMEVNRTTGLDVIRFQSVRAPLPAEEDVPETLDTCMAGEAREHLASLAGEGTSLDVEIEAYANAPNGELWAEIYHGGDDLALEMVEAGYAVVDPESVKDPQKLDALNAAQEQARQDERGIFSKDAECTLPSYVAPVLAGLNDLPPSPPANDVTELTKYIGEMNAIRSDAQQAVAVLTAIPDTSNDDSVAALAWGDAKEEYISTVETHLEEIRGLIEDAQDKRADLRDTNQASNSSARQPQPQPEQPTDLQPVNQRAEQPAQQQSNEAQPNQQPTQQQAAAEPEQEPSASPQGPVEADAQPQNTPGPPELGSSNRNSMGQGSQGDS